MFTSPQMTTHSRFEALNTDYDEHVVASAKEHYEATVARERHRVDQTLKLLGARRGKWLDVGCASGVLLSESERVGFVPSGFDVRLEAAQQLRQARGWDVRAAPSLGGASFPPQSFDVISMIDTLQFMPEPLADLAAIRELLAPGGVLVCRVPNARYLLLKNVGLLAYVRFGRWSFMNANYHIIHFTAKSLRRMLEDAGFRIVHQEAGRPWLAGSPLNVLAKRCWLVIARCLRLVGIDLGVAIDVWAIVNPEGIPGALKAVQGSPRS
jgi:2-polyprenyl-3-methyl-5-hydroxy-6-metoxy-1,4-benzoquinol methylase